MAHDGTVEDLVEPPKLERLYSVNEVGAALGVSRRTVYRLLETGALKSTRAGVRHRFSEADIREYVERGRRRDP